MTDRPAADRLRALFATRPLIAILRGLSPEEAVPIGDALVEAGIPILEVPLNSPRPYDSIGLLAGRYGDRALVGAGTVLEPDEARKVAEAGGALAVAPETNPAMIAAAIEAGLAVVPGFATPSEAFAALRAGAGRRTPSLPIPAPLFRAAARLAGRTEIADRLIGDLVVDTGALRALGWSAVVATRDGLARLVATGGDGA